MASSNSSGLELSRKEAIKVLEMFLYKQCSLGRTEFAYDADTVWKAVKMAAESLKTDEAYQLEYEKPSGKWIPTSETMPDNPSENVLVCDIDGDIYKAYLSDYDGWRRSEDFEKVKNVIAWQPLPLAYKMESEDHK